MVTKSKKALLASLTAFLCVMLTVFGLSVLSVSSSGTAKADGDSAAKIGETSYETLEAAIDAAKENDTIELLNDVSVNSQLVIDKAVTLKLGGHTLTSNYVIGTAGSYAIVLNAKTTITNGSIKVGDARAITANAALTMTDVEIKNTIQGGHATVALSADNTAYSITNCKIDGAYSVSNFANNATVTIAGSKLIGRGNTLYHNGTYYGLKLTVSDTEITSSHESGCGVYISGSESTQKDEKNQNGVGGRQQATFTNCTISGANGIEVKYTDLTLDGCTVKTTKTESSYTQNNNGPAASGFAVVATDNAVNGKTPVPTGTIVVKGDGEYTGPVGLGMLESVRTDYADFKDESIRISGGTFSVKVPEEYCEAGYIPQDNGDGTYGVKQGVYVAETNNVKYETLQAAIAAAESGNTVKLIANTRENVTVAKKLTLDLNGYIINGGKEKGKPTITVNNSLTIKDSSEAQTGTVMREDTAENSGVNSHYVIDIQGKSAFLRVEGGNFKNDSGNESGKGSSLIRVGNDSVKEAFPTLTITGGTFTQDNFIVIKVDYGTLHFKGGELNSSDSYAIENWKNAYVKGGVVNGQVASWTYSDGASSTLEISGGTINGNVSAINYGSTTEKKATISITGGTVNGTLGIYDYNANNGKYTETTADKATIEVTAGTFSEDPSKYVVENSSITRDENGNYGVTKAYLAKVGETSYYTMDEAFKAQTASGEEIVLLRDYTSNSVFNSGSINRTVNLNGLTWTYTGTDTDSAAFEINYSEVTLTVKNGTIISSQLVGLIPSAMSGTITYDNAGIIFENVKMTANGHSGIETNGNNTNDTVTLRNSTLNVPNGYGIYFPSSGTLTIDNSTINAKTMGVQICSGTLSILGEGTAITVTGNAVPKTENDGAIEDGAAISIVGRAGYKGLVKAEIAGGTFTSAGGNAIKAYEWANKEESEFDNSASIVEVTGGVFSGKVDKDLLRCGYVLNTVDGNSTVKEGKGFTEVRVVLNESLAMKLMLDKSVTSNYVVVTYTSLEDGNVKTVTLNDHGDYYLFDKIMPQMIDVKFTFELYGENGVMLDRLTNYSIVDYLGNVLKTNAGSTEAFKNLAASLIEYANRAKAVKGLDTISPVFYTEDGKSEIELNYAKFVATNPMPAKETASSVSVGDVHAIYKANVVFDNAYTLYFYANTAIATNYTYKLDGKEIAFDENGVYSVTVKASEITHGYTIEVYGEDKTTPVQTVTYGVSIYSVRMQNEATPYGELYVATYYYGVAVNKYAGA